MVPDSWGTVMNKAVVIALPILALPDFMLIAMYFLAMHALSSTLGYYLPRVFWPFSQSVVFVHAGPTI